MMVFESAKDCYKHLVNVHGGIGLNDDENYDEDDDEDIELYD